jgi:predicted transporter
MYEKIQTVVVIVVLVLVGAATVSRRLRNVAWLQRFRFEWPQMSKERQARARRPANVLAGVEFILLGLVIPPGYLVSEVMLMSDTSKTEFAFVLAGSLLCIGLGIAAIARSRR